MFNGRLESPWMVFEYLIAVSTKSHIRTVISEDCLSINIKFVSYESMSMCFLLSYLSVCLCRSVCVDLSVWLSSHFSFSNYVSNVASLPRARWL